MDAPACELFETLTDTGDQVRELLSLFNLQRHERLVEQFNVIFCPLTAVGLLPLGGGGFEPEE